MDDLAVTNRACPAVGDVVDRYECGNLAAERHRGRRYSKELVQ
jgi:hypothetical protein